MSSDIQADRLIFRKTPPSYHPYIKLARLDRPIGIWLLLFPCWWAIALASDGVMNMTATSWKIALLVAFGAVFMRAAGCIVNDLWDHKLDASVERTKTRPLASGEIGFRQAAIFLCMLLALSFIILIQLPRAAIWLGILSLLPVAIYPKMKQITWWPQLFLGFTFNWGALLGWSAVTGLFPSKTSLLLYISGIFWTLGYDTVYAHQDKEDDRMIGVKSTALLFGEKSRPLVAVFYALSLIFLIISKFSAEPSLLTPLLIAPLAVHFGWQIKNWNMNDPASCLRIFKSNQVYGWLALLMLAV